MRRLTKSTDPELIDPNKEMIQVNRMRNEQEKITTDTEDILSFIR